MNQQILEKFAGYYYFLNTRVDNPIKKLIKKLLEQKEKWVMKLVYSIRYKFEVIK